MGKGTQTRDFGVSKREGHDATRFYSSRLYDGVKINEKQPIVDNSEDLQHLVLTKENTKSTTYSGVHLQSVSEILDQSLHLIYYNPNSLIDAKNSSIQSHLCQTRITQEIEQLKNKLVTGGRIVVICQNHITEKPQIERRDEPSETHFYPVHALLSSILIDCGFILRGHVILGDYQNQHYGIAVIGCKSIMKRQKRGKREILGKREMWEKTDTILRDQFLDYTKSVWRRNPGLVCPSISQEHYSEQQDYLQRFLHLFSFSEDWIGLIRLSVSEDTLRYLGQIRTNLLIVNPK